MRQYLYVCMALAVVAGGCTSTSNSGTSAGTSASQPQVQPTRQELSGTTWRLVHFQSSDDAIGTIIPPNLEKYTLQFMPDGKLAMQLDCNRGTATWKVADVTANSGTLTISPVAMTRAMCGPGAIDTRLARDMGFVTSYVIAGGKLNLALKMDGGIYVWEPAPTPPQ